MKFLNGEEIKVDWSSITQSEWEFANAKDTPREESDKIFARLVGMDGQNIKTILNPRDYRAIGKAVADSWTHLFDDDSDVKN